MLSLDDAITKLEWGQQHIKDLNLELKAISKNGIGIEVEKNLGSKIPDPSQIIFRFGKMPTIPKRVGVLIGETVQCFRSSLDYLAWFLVNRHNGSLTERQERDIYFPMARSPDSFRDNVDRWLIGVPDSQRATIEAYQPYQSTTAGRAMLYLRTLSDTDKHRIILPVFMFPDTVNLEAKPAGYVFSVDKHFVFGQELKEGAKILTAHIRPNIGRQVKMNMKIRVEAEFMFPTPLVAPPPPYTGVTVEKVMEIISSTCLDILSKFRPDH